MDSEEGFIDQEDVMSSNYRKALRERLLRQGPQIDPNAPFPEPHTNPERAVNISYVVRSTEVHFADLARDIIALKTLVPDYLEHISPDSAAAYEPKRMALLKLSEKCNELSTEFGRWCRDGSEPTPNEEE